jgi:hypothetical protein
MAFLGQISCLACILSIGADEIGEINFHRAAIAATCAAQAGPDIAAVDQIVLWIQHRPFDDLARRKAGYFTADRAASGTQAAFHTVVDLLLAEAFCLFHIFK